MDEAERANGTKEDYREPAGPLDETIQSIRTIKVEDETDSSVS